MRGAEDGPDLRRVRVAWVALDGRPPRAVWTVEHDGALLVVCGPGEQSLPGADDAARAVVVVRGPASLDGRDAELECTVDRVEPGSAAWDQAVPALTARRLNGSEPARLPERWAARAVVLRLQPAGSGPGATP